MDALSADETRAWRSLALRAIDANPMCEPNCVLAAAAHLPYGHEISLVVVEARDRFYAATPIRRLARHGSFRLPVASTDIRRMTYLGTPLVDRERPVEAWAEMLKTLSTHRSDGGWMYFVVSWLSDGPAFSALRQATSRLRFPMQVLEDFEQPLLHRRTDGNYTDGQSKRHLSDYRRRAKRMAEHLGAELEVVNLAGDAAAVDEFIALEAAGYKRDNGVAMRTQPGEPAYFADMCRRFAAEDRLHLLTLRAGERTVAMQISLEADPGLFLIKVSHDEELNHFDPGVQLHLRAMEYFHNATGAEWIDVCTFPDNDLLLRLYPDRRRTLSVLIGLGGPLNSAVVRAIPTAKGLIHNIHSVRERVSATRKKSHAAH